MKKLEYKIECIILIFIAMKNQQKIPNQDFPPDLAHIFS